MSSSQNPRGSILLVEDNADVLETYAELLEGRGYRVARAANGQQALDYLRQHQVPSLILLDLLMPVLDGYQLLQQIRGNRTLSTVPVVVISAVADPEHARSLGVTACFTKPPELDRLLEIVAQHCGPDA